jgi:hypothetical protein
MSTAVSFIRFRLGTTLDLTGRSLVDDNLISAVPESLLGKLSSFEGSLQESEDEYDFLEIPESFWGESEREDEYDRIETPGISDADYERILRLSNPESRCSVPPTTQSVSCLPIGGRVCSNVV